MSLVYEWPRGSEQRWVNFPRDEMVCRCGCGALPDPVFMEVLQIIRQDCGFALPVTSGGRCSSYDRKLYTDRGIPDRGGNGPHTTGLAADIQISGYMAHGLIANAVERGITGLGIKQHGDHADRFIHLDLLPESHKRPWIWSY